VAATSSKIHAHHHPFLKSRLLQDGINRSRRPSAVKCKQHVRAIGEEPIRAEKRKKPCLPLIA
jgi:hypothetical protein